VRDAQITYEDYLQSEQIIIRSNALRADQLVCLAAIRTTKPFPIVSFENADVARKDRGLEKQRWRQESRDWLAERSLLADLPVYDPLTEQPMEFARRIEAFCGIKPGSAFEQNKQLGTITLNMDWLGRGLRRGWPWQRLRAKRHNKQFECLIRAMSASAADEHGIRFGFVGNEAYGERR